MENRLAHTMAGRIAESIVLGDFDEALSQSDMADSVSISIDMLISQGKIKAESIPVESPSDLLDMEWDDAVGDHRLRAAN